MLRELLFGDVPLAQWAGTSDASPWSEFRQAHAAIMRGDPRGAEHSLRAVLAQRGLESRHYLQAWDALRRLGVQPAASEAKHLYGVVLDIPVEDGLDTLASYEDGTARFVHFTGRIIVWETPEPEITQLIRAVHQAAHPILVNAGPWEGDRPALPLGEARVSVLAPSGIHFGQAPFETLLNEPMAAPVIHTGARLMEALMAKVPASPYP